MVTKIVKVEVTANDFSDGELAKALKCRIDKGSISQIAVVRYFGGLTIERITNTDIAKEVSCRLKRKIISESDICKIEDAIKCARGKRKVGRPAASTSKPRGAKIFTRRT